MTIPIITDGDMDKINNDDNQKYLEQFLKNLKEDPTQLRDIERKLGERYLVTQNAADECSTRISEINKKITHLHEELHKVRDTLTAEAGKAAGILESVLALRND